MNFHHFAIILNAEEASVQIFHSQTNLAEIKNL